MCTQYNPPNARTLRDMPGFDGVQMPAQDWPVETFPGYGAPIVTRGVPGRGGAALVCSVARFGLVPRWSRNTHHGNDLSRRTYNARSETAAEKPSYRSPWRERQYALVPMLNYVEPCWESGHALRWRIAPASGEPFAAAGLSTVQSFQAAMAVYLACNAVAYAWFLLQGRRHNVLQTTTP